MASAQRVNNPEMPEQPSDLSQNSRSSPIPPVCSHIFVPRLFDASDRSQTSYLRRNKTRYITVENGTAESHRVKSRGNLAGRAILGTAESAYNVAVVADDRDL